MSTFYMQGSMSPEQSIKIFESFFLPVQQIIALDNDFHMELERHFYDEDDDNAEDYFNIVELKALQSKLLEFLISCEEGINNEDDFDLAKTYKELVSNYREVYSILYTTVISVMENDDVSENEIEKFNILLRKASSELDSSLNKFYDAAEQFADENNIGLS